MKILWLRSWQGIYLKSNETENRITEYTDLMGFRTGTILHGVTLGWACFGFTFNKPAACLLRFLVPCWWYLDDVTHLYFFNMNLHKLRAIYLENLATSSGLVSFTVLSRLLVYQNVQFPMLARVRDPSSPRPVYEYPGLYTPEA